MKKAHLIYLMLFFALVIGGCSKKEKMQNIKESSTNNESKTEYVEFKCNGMHCSGCEESISSSVKKLEGIKEVVADAKNKVVKVKFDNKLTTKNDIEKSINAAGYDTETSKSENKHNCDMENK